MQPLTAWGARIVLLIENTHTLVALTTTATETSPPRFFAARTIRIERIVMDLLDTQHCCMFKHPIPSLHRIFALLISQVTCPTCRMDTQPFWVFRISRRCCIVHTAVAENPHIGETPAALAKSTKLHCAFTCADFRHAVAVACVFAYHCYFLDPSLMPNAASTSDLVSVPSCSAFASSNTTMATDAPPACSA